MKNAVFCNVEVYAVYLFTIRMAVLEATVNNGGVVIASQLIHTNHQLTVTILVLVQVQVLVLNLSNPTSFRFALRTFFWTRLGPCVAYALLILFYINHTSHQLQKKKVIDVTASTGCISYVIER